MNTEPTKIRDLEVGDFIVGPDGIKLYVANIDKYIEYCDVRLAFADPVIYLSRQPLGVRTIDRNLLVNKVVKEPPTQKQQLKLANDLFAEVGRSKFMTIRKGRRDIKLGDLELETTDKVGDDFIRCTVRVHRISYSKVGGLCDREAKEDGFKSVQDLIWGMQRFYPDLDENTEITLVYWS